MRPTFRKLRRALVNTLCAERLYPYTSASGQFDYAAYYSAQNETNKQKLERIWVREEHVRFLTNYIRSRRQPTFGLCHGTRRGVEQRLFSSYLDIPVLGTEIAETAQQFPQTLQWDFHELRKEWISACDFVFSNSFDHSYDPAHCLRQWLRCLKPQGLCIIEHSRRMLPASSSWRDPFGIRREKLIERVEDWTSKRAEVVDVILEFATDERQTSFLVIQEKESACH